LYIVRLEFSDVFISFKLNFPRFSPVFTAEVSLSEPVRQLAKKCMFTHCYTTVIF